MSLLSFASLLTFLSLTTAHADPIPSTTIGFHNITGVIGNYYNGGAGPNVGIETTAIASGGWVDEHTNPTFNVPSGFTTGFAVVWNVRDGMRIRIFDGLDGTGTQLATQDFFGISGTASLAFSGTAKSVRLERFGQPDFLGYDNLTFGSTTVGTPVVEAPGVATSAATSVGSTTATLNGSVNPGGVVTTAQFEYGLTDSYGSTATVTLSPNDGSSGQVVNKALTGLTPNTTYHFRLTATNSAGTQNGSDLTFTTTAPPAYGLHFDGLNDWVNIPDPGNVFTFTNSVTLEAWVKPDTNTPTIPMRVVGDVNNEYAIMIEADGRVRLYFDQYSTLFGTSVIPAGQWTHLAASIQMGVPNGVKLYVNGVQEAQTTGDAGLTPFGGGMIIGFNGNYAGSIDEVRIWSSARSGADIANFMNTELAVMPSCLVGYYKFNQGTIGGNNAAQSTAVNYAGGPAGTLQNFALTGNTSNYVAGSGITEVASVASTTDPEVGLESNATSIILGDSTPSTTDGTNFGSLMVGNFITQTFTVKNTGAADLNVSSIAVSGTNAANFTLGTLTPASPVAANSSATFTVTFTPSAASLRTATISVNSNDCNESAYSFAVQGTGTPAPVAPQGTDKSIDVTVNTTYTFSDTDWGFSDPGDSPENAFTALKLTTLPAAGTLSVEGIAATAGQVVSRIMGPGGATWTARESNRAWFGMASSANGLKLAAVAAGGQIYTSTDGGVNWTARETNRSWYSVASSADGTKLVAVANAGQIYTSTDSGVTWTPRDSNRAWYNVASSAEGTKLAAVVENGQIYTSTDSGVNWTPRETNRRWRGIASSADGTKLVAGNFGGQLYTSTDSGVSWTARESARSWNSLASSADGTKLVAVDSAVGSHLYTSTDSGVTWTARAPATAWYSVASSADGTRLIAGAEGPSLLMTSTDSGVTWTARDTNRRWLSVATSADGTRLAAGDFLGKLYTSAGSAPLITYTAPSSTGPQSFTFQVQDDGVVNNLDLSPNTITLNVPNTAPTVAATNATVTVNEGTATSNALTISDAESNLATVTTDVGSIGVLASGTYVSEFATPTSPRRFDFDSAGNIYVGNLAGVVTKYDPSGNQLMQFTLASPAVVNDGENFTGIDVDAAGNIYVTYSGHTHTRKYDSSGNLIGNFGPATQQVFIRGGRFGGPSGNYYQLDRSHKLVLVNPSGTELWRTSGYNAGLNEPPNTGLNGNVDVAIHPTTGAAYVADFGFIKGFDATGATTGYFNTSGGLNNSIDMDSQGNLWAGSGTSIRKFTTAGIALGSFGTTGTGAGQFQNVNSIRFDAAGNLWVLDQTRSKLMKFNIGQSSYAWVHTPADGPLTQTVTITATDSIGAVGTTSFTLNVNNVAPTIALTGNATVASGLYTLNLGSITDPGADTVTAYSINWGDGNTENFTGNPSSAAKTHAYASIGNKTITVALTDEDGTHASAGTKTVTVQNTAPAVARAAATVTVPEGSAAFNSGTFADANGDTVTITASVGTLTQSVAGNWAHQLTLSQGDTPVELALDNQDNLYVVNDFQNKLYKYDSSGSLVTSWTVAGNPIGVAVDSANGWLYVSLRTGNRIDKFTLSGTFLTTWGTAGSGNGQFNSPLSVALDTAGDVYVSDGSNNRIQVFSPSGTFLRKWGSLGSGNGQFNFPQGLRISPGGTVYVADRANHRIQYFDTVGNFLGKWGSSGSGNGQFNQPGGLGIDPAGNIFVGDLVNNRIQKFTSAGFFVDKLGPSTAAGNLAQPHATAFPAMGNSVYIADYVNGRVVKFGTPGTWSWSHTPTDGPAGPTTVTITANDGTDTTTTTFALNVTNVAPTATFSKSTSSAINEDTSTPPDVSFTSPVDPSTADVSAGLKYSYDFNNDGTWDDGDGTYAGSLTAATKSIPASYFASPAVSPLVVKGRIIDKDGGSTDYTVSIAINHAPTAINGPLTIVEDFDYGNTAGSLAGKNGGAGFSTAWDSGTYTNSGLTFSNLSSPGGAWSGSSGSRNFSASLAIAGPITGDFLFKRPLNPGAVQMLGIGGTNNQNAQIALAPLNDGNGGTMPQVALRGGPGFANVSPVLDPNTTYMYRFAYAGSSITVWILTAAQYDNFAPGGLAAADLNAASIGSGATQVTGRATQNGNLNSNMAGLFTYTFQANGVVMDRLRITGTPVGASLVVVENAAINTAIGTLLASDADASQTITYTLVSGTGSTDNAKFNISGSTLRNSVVFDYETQQTASIRVRATDQGGLSYETALSVSISNVNEAVTDIALTPSSIPENNAANATVGTLSATGLDVGDTHTFTLVTGTGSTDNGSFTIAGDTLKLTPSADYETKPSYSIRVRATDQGGLFFEKALTVTVTDVNYPPTITRTNATVTVDEGSTATNTGTHSDPDGNGTVTITASQGSITSTTLNSGLQADYTTGGSWRTASVAKPLDADGNNIYGSDGYGMYGLAGVESVVNPTYATITRNPALAFFSGTSSYLSIDNPANPTGPQVLTGVVYNAPGGTNATTFFTVSFSQARTVRLGVLVDNADFVAISPTTLRLRQTSGGTRDTGFLTAGAPAVRNHSNDWYFFDIAAQAGDVYEISGNNDPLFSSNGIGGVVLDTGVSLGQGTWDWSQLAADDANTTVTVTANDGANAPTTTFDLIVNNVAPTATFSSSASTVNEATLSPPSVSFTNQLDPGTTDVAAGLKYSYDYNNDGTWDDGDGTYAGSLTVATKSIPASYFASPATSPLVVKGRIIDKDGGSTDYTVSIAINQAPTGITLGGAVPSVPGVATWSPMTLYTNVPAQVLTNGTRHAAVVFDFNDLTENGVLFDGYIDAGTFRNGSLISTNPPGHHGFITAAYGQLVRYSGFTTDPNGFIDITGLTVGATYQVQLFTPYWDSPFPSIISTAGGPSVTIECGYDTHLPQSLVGTFTAAAATQRINWGMTTSHGGLAAISVRRVVGGLSLAENNAIGDTITTLGAIDADAGDTFTYSLVSGTGSEDNAAFSIVGNQLKAAVVFDYETKTSYALRVRASDASGAFVEKALTVSITDVAEFDYVITNVGSVLTITGGQGGATTNDEIFINESGANEMTITATGRIFSPAGPISLVSVTQIIFNAGAGNDVINVGDFPNTLMPSLTINGNAGNDTVNLNGSIHFAAGSNLDLNLQNDTATPGIDSLVLGTHAELLWPPDATGNADIKVSRNIELAAGSSLQLGLGSITLEANQQTTPTSGDFVGISATDATISTQGTGAITIKGKGGNADTATATNPNAGLSLDGTEIMQQGAGNLVLQGTSVANGDGAAGVVFDNSNVETNGGNVSLTGSATGSGSGNDRPGVLLTGNLGADINVTGAGTLSVTAAGAPGNGNGNAGLIVEGTGSLIVENGALSVTATGGQGTSGTTGNDRPGALILGHLTSTGTGNISIDATAGISSAPQNGVTLNGSELNGGGSVIETASGNVSITGTPSGTGNSIALDSSGAPLITTEDGGSVALIGDKISIVDSTGSGIFAIQSSGPLSFTTETPGAPSPIVLDPPTLALIQAASVSVNNVLLNSAPTTLVLSTTNVFDGTASGTIIATLSATDADLPAQTLSFGFASGADSADNAAFTIVGNALKPAAALNFIDQANYNIRLVVTDGAGGAYEKAFTITVVAPDYNITLVGGVLTITDLTGHGDTLAVDESGPNEILFSAPGRTFRYNYGSFSTGNSGGISLVGVTSVVINAAEGDGTINVGDFPQTLFPSLTINGDEGNDVVNLNGSIHFAAGSNLDLDLQNDTPTPGIDQVALGTHAQLIWPDDATGNVDIKVSRNITLPAGSSIEVGLGSIVLEANQQTSPTSGDFVGISIDGATISSQGSGAVTLKGRGGNADTGSATEPNAGISLFGSTITIEGSGNLVLQGTSVANGDNAAGIAIENSNATTNGGNMELTGTATGTGSGDNRPGIVLGGNLGARLETTGSGDLSLVAVGAPGSGDGNAGIVLNGTSTVTVENGDLELAGQGGQGSTVTVGDDRPGLIILGHVTSTGTGDVIVQGIAGTSSTPQSGVSINGSEHNGGGSVIETSGGNVIVGGTPTGGGSSLKLDSSGAPLITTEGGGNVVLEGDQISLLDTSGSGVPAISSSGNLEISAETPGAPNPITLDVNTLALIQSGTLIVNQTTTNVAPATLTLAPVTVAENSAVGATVGTLSATDTDLPAQTLTFGFASGPGADDNASFTITGNALKAAVSLDYETQPSYNVRLSVSDGFGGTLEKAFVVTISDVADTPLQLWRSANFPGLFTNTGNAANNADPDGDTYSNLLEFAFGTDPNDSGSGPGEITFDAGAITLRAQPKLTVTNSPTSVDFRANFGRRKDYVAAELTYKVQFSADMQSWVDGTATPTVRATDAEMEAVSVKYPFFLPDGRKARYHRVQVSVP